ncbi:MAG: 1,4-dihydroxy-6-naphthoate synthase [Bacteroidetes bacterium]|nr:1,4-dihydroxy-6-naphthoate synthase [Bacteroidota bacterium]
MQISFSPCPNDTFIFDALVNGKIDTMGLQFAFSMHDVETLNHMALEGKTDLIKISIHTLLYAIDNYRLLPCGGALGYGNGPLLVTKPGLDVANRKSLQVALPGRYTTANLLLSLFAPELINKTYLPYDEIEDAVINGKADAGVIIHENRFTYDSKGLVKQVDMGEWWESKTGLPVPLGGIAIRRSLDDHIKERMILLIRKSIDFARQNEGAKSTFVRSNAREMEKEVIRKHIDLFVNDFSYDIGATGAAAINKLFDAAFQSGLIPAAPTDWLYQPCSSV